MCYSGKCRFEDNMGNCILFVDYNLFENKFGINACLVGGMITSPLEEQFYKNNEVKIKKILSEYFDEHRSIENMSWL